jgi:hypothetical protein
MVADELRRQADQFIDLADLEPIIAREASARAGRGPNSHARAGSHEAMPRSRAADDLADEL